MVCLRVSKTGPRIFVDFFDDFSLSFSIHSVFAHNHPVVCTSKTSSDCIREVMEESLACIVKILSELDDLDVNMVSAMLSELCNRQLRASTRDTMSEGGRKFHEKHVGQWLRK